MPEIVASTTVSADAAAVWRVVRDFGGLPAWQPAVTDSALGEGDAPDRVGSVRTLTTADGGTVVEALASHDDSERSLSYEILDSPYSVRRYRGAIRVAPVTTTGESFVEWSVVFDCDAAEADALVALFRDGVLATGLRGLAEHVRRAGAAHPGGVR
ncbi:SRPBCC family protein [Amycolatopsis circi]|uniref:SRPBCC family protein n=1 Tax=Amycolatopsis circi TaxID=871959 RepID=UPI000E256282|nr:SRPBCC family protein [Amycolatopsis circi]